LAYTQRFFSPGALANLDLELAVGFGQRGREFLDS